MKKRELWKSLSIAGGVGIITILPLISSCSKPKSTLLFNDYTITDNGPGSLTLNYSSAINWDATINTTPEPDSVDWSIGSFTGAGLSSSNLTITQDVSNKKLAHLTLGTGLAANNYCCS
jgi:hypothetical protein